MSSERAETYTHGHHESVLRSHRWRTAENSAAYLLPHLAPGMCLLDVGCGPGTITIDLARRVAPGRVLGLDTAEAPLHGARADAAAGAITNVEFAIGDAYALPVEDASFDVVHAHQVLQHLADPVAALREMARACRTGGIVAARESDYGAMTWFPADPVLDRWLALYQSVSRANGGDPDAGRRLLSWAHTAGFADVTAGASTWCFASPADRAWWGGLWAERISHSTLGDQAIAEGFATAAELAGIAEAWRRWAAHDDGWFIVTSAEILWRRPR